MNDQVNPIPEADRGEGSPQTLSEADKQAKIDELLGDSPDPFLNQGRTDTGSDATPAEKADEYLGIPSEAEAEQEPPSEEAADPPVEPATEIDYNLKVPQSDGREPLTIGEMKDKLTEYERSLTQQIEQRNKIAAERQELNQLMQELGQVPEHIQEKAKARRETYIREQHNALVAAEPEMADREGFLRWSKRIRNVAAEYGFSELEIGSITDYRPILAFMDNIRMRDQLERANSAAKEVKSRPKRPKAQAPRPGSGADSGKVFAKAMQSNDRVVRERAMEHLLRNAR